MEHEKLRRRICFEAAQLLHSRRESNFTTARWRAARGITSSYVNKDALPTDMEIRAVLQELASTASNSPRWTAVSIQPRAASTSKSNGRRGRAKLYACEGVRAAPPASGTRR